MTTSVSGVRAGAGASSIEYSSSAIPSPMIEGSLPTDAKALKVAGDALRDVVATAEILRSDEPAAIDEGKALLSMLTKIRNQRKEMQAQLYARDRGLTASDEEGAPSLTLSQFRKDTRALREQYIKLLTQEIELKRKLRTLTEGKKH